ncbi:t-complex protein 1 subunit eta [Hordeum vulgare]|nr:t-complex protein 1 subunit eta [Hordeum vulgare]
MIFSKVMTLEWAQNVAHRPRVVNEEDHRWNRRRERRLSIAEMDEHAMAEWRRQFPQDVLDGHGFFAQRRAERAEKWAEQVAYREDRRTRKQVALFQMELKESSTWSSDDEFWADAFITMEESDTTRRSPTTMMRTSLLSI